MNTKVLESWGEEEADMGNGIGGETASLGRLRSKSMSRGLPKKASRNAGIIKVKLVSIHIGNSFSVALLLNLHESQCIVIHKCMLLYHT